MGPEPRPSSSVGSRNIPATAGSITDTAALPLARLDRSPRQALLPEVGSWHDPAAAAQAAAPTPAFSGFPCLREGAAVAFLLSPPLMAEGFLSPRAKAMQASQGLVWQRFAEAQSLLTYPGHHRLTLAGKASALPSMLCQADRFARLSKMPLCILLCSNSLKPELEEVE